METDIDLLPSCNFKLQLYLTLQEFIESGRQSARARKAGQSTSAAGQPAKAARAARHFSHQAHQALEAAHLLQLFHGRGHFLMHLQELVDRTRTRLNSSP